MFALVGVDGLARGVTIPIPDAGLTLGQRASPVLAGDLHLAPDHVALAWYADQLVVQDLGSPNGTWVNGHRIAEPVRVRVGDHVGAGSSLFQLLYVPPAPRSRQDTDRLSRAANHDAVAIAGGINASAGGVGVGRDLRGDVHTAHAAGERARAAGRDYFEVDNRFDLDITGFQRARGLARFLLIAGVLVGLVGFGLFGYPIVKGFVDTAQDFAARAECDERFPFLDQPRRNINCKADVGSGINLEVMPWIPLGVGLFFGGIVLTAIGRMIRHDDGGRSRRRVRDGP